MATPTNTTDTERRGASSYGVYDNKSPVAKAGTNWVWMLIVAAIILVLLFWLF